MNKVPDRAKMRREYLRKKAGLVFLWFLGGGMVTIPGILGLFFLVLFCLCIVDQTAGNFRDNCFAFTIVLGAAALIGRRLYRYSIVKSQSLLYIPPVREQLPTLPAEEVLLRGSQALPASPTELLRPAGRQETPAEELLRASGGELPDK